MSLLFKGYSSKEINSSGFYYFEPNAISVCFLAVALFNTFNAGTIVDGGPPPPFWIVLILNPLLCIYGLVNNKN